jgi:hypothetical protein
VYLFWSSHEEKRACVRLSPVGGHGRSWSFHGSPWGARRRGEGGGGREEGEGGAAWVLGRQGRHGEGHWAGFVQPRCCYCALSVCYA